MESVAVWGLVGAATVWCAFRLRAYFASAGKGCNADSCGCCSQSGKAECGMRSENKEG